VVTKKKRRSKLAQATAQRQAERRAIRAEHRRRINLAIVATLSVLAVAGLSTWIVTHQGEREVTPLVTPFDQFGSPSTTSTPAPAQTPTATTPKPTAKESK
jgi:hypothetical protein